MIFGNYTPDLPDRDNAITVAKNCVPAAKSYKSIGSPLALTGATTARPQGAISVKWTDNSPYNFCGDATKLYRLDTAGNTWTDISSTTYTTAAANHWEFVKWGTKVIAVNGSDVPEVATINTGSFANLGGTPPKAKHIAVIRDFVVLGNINDAGTDYPYRLHWSAINDETGWTVGTNQSDTQDLQTGGNIQRIIGGEYGTVFCESAIYRMTYVGPPFLFQFDEVEINRGTPAPQSVVQLGENQIFYLGIDGFYFFNGSQSAPIGASKVNKTFYNDLDTNYYDRIWATVDPINTLVFWGYPGQNNSSGKCNKIICYNYKEDRWSGPIEIDHYMLYPSLSTGYTLEQLDSVLGYTNLDTLPFSLDSRVWIGGELVLSLFDSDFKLANLSGDALTATIETGEYNLNPGGRAFVSGVRPLFDGAGTATCYLGTRNTVNGSETWTAGSAQNTQTGLCPFRLDAFYHRLRVKVSGGFDHLYGAEPEFVASGRK